MFSHLSHNHCGAHAFLMYTHYPLHILLLVFCVMSYNVIEMLLDIIPLHLHFVRSHVLDLILAIFVKQNASSG